MENKKYEQEAKERWGETEAYQEYARRNEGVSPEEREQRGRGLDAIFEEFAECLKGEAEPHSEQAQELVKKLQDYITENHYTCTDKMLGILGQMYVADGRFRVNINKHGEGTAEFIFAAIEVYCKG